MFETAIKVIKVIDSIQEIYQVHFIIGSNQRNENIDLLISKSTKKYFMYQNLSAKDVFKTMQKCDVAICPASTFSLEACAVGIGLFSGITADNQKQNYIGLQNNQLIFPLGDIRTSTLNDLKKRINKNLTVNSIQRLVENQQNIFNAEIRTRYLNLFVNL